MDWTATFGRIEWHTVIDAANQCKTNNTHDIDREMAQRFGLRAKGNRLKRSLLNQQRCKFRLVLLLFGLWMNLITFTNGKCSNNFSHFFFLLAHEHSNEITFGERKCHVFSFLFFCYVAYYRF